MSALVPSLFTLRHPPSLPSLIPVSVIPLLSLLSLCFSFSFSLFLYLSLSLNVSLSLAAFLSLFFFLSLSVTPLLVRKSRTVCAPQPLVRNAIYRVLFLRPIIHLRILTPSLLPFRQVPLSISVSVSFSHTYTLSFSRSVPLPPLVPRLFPVRLLLRLTSCFAYPYRLNTWL